MGRHVPLELRWKVESFVAQFTLELALSRVAFVPLVGYEAVAVGKECSTRVTQVDV